MTLRAWFSCKGRISRKTWWLYYFLIPNAIHVAVALLDDHALPALSIGEVGGVFDGLSPVSLAVLLLGIWGGVAGQAKRWHDHNRSGWWALPGLLPPLLIAARMALDPLSLWWFVLMQVFLPVVFLVMVISTPSVDDASLALFNDISEAGLDAAPLMMPAIFLMLSLIWLLVFLISGILRGTRGPNRFGPDPLAPAPAANIALPKQPQ
ncbi:MAG: DUF805 domain-containing protein [Acetobacteraceae bacterium]|jgi:uncharacterized membrane protein YhaH (DUF805 family)